LYISETLLYISETLLYRTLRYRNKSVRICSEFSSDIYVTETPNNSAYNRDFEQPNTTYNSDKHPRLRPAPGAGGTSRYLCITPQSISVICEGALYGLATISKLLKMIGLFYRTSSLLQGSFANETYSFKERHYMRRSI